MTPNRRMRDRCPGPAPTCRRRSSRTRCSRRSDDHAGHRWPGAGVVHRRCQPGADHLPDRSRRCAPRVVPLASLQVAKGTLLGGVYAYLDNENRVVMIDGSNHLLRVSHARDGALGRWKLTVTQSTDVSSVIPSGDGSVGLVPDYAGNVWFATGNGVVGVAKLGGGVTSLQLPAGEQVANSISSAPSGRVAVATTFALYELNLDGAGEPANPLARSV